MTALKVPTGPAYHVYTICTFKFTGKRSAR